MAKSVLVIGGGIAGLASAIELSRAGCFVTVLEARERLGGRIFTVASNDTPIELGAEFIHGCDEQLWKRIRAGKSKTTEVPNRNQLFSNGTFRSIDLWQEIENVMKLIDKEEPDRSFRDFVARQKLPDATKQLASSFVEGFDAADVTKIGVHGIAASESGSGEEDGSEQFRFSGGYMALTEYLARELESAGGSIRLNTLVRSIHWRRSHVEITADEFGKQTTHNAEAAIITLPLGVLKSGAVAFEPPLTTKQEAIDNLEFGNVRKVILNFGKCLWPEPNFGFIHALDESIPTWWSTEHDHVLTGWAGGPKADALNTCDDEQLLSKCADILGRLWSLKSSKVRDEIIEFHSHDWRADPFSSGAYSYVPVGGVNLPELLAQPIDHTLFFAGEATATESEPGTVHGALASGLRAVRQLLDHERGKHA